MFTLLCLFSAKTAAGRVWVATSALEKMWGGGQEPFQATMLHTLFELGPPGVFIFLQNGSGFQGQTCGTESEVSFQGLLDIHDQAFIFYQNKEAFNLILKSPKDAEDKISSSSRSSVMSWGEAEITVTVIAQQADICSEGTSGDEDFLDSVTSIKGWLL